MTESDPRSPREHEGPDGTQDLGVRPQSRIVLDGDTGEARLLELIRVDEEEDGLDFKRSYDLRVAKDQLECVKILVCMANTGGGYVVLGVDESAPGAKTRHHVVGCPDEHLRALEVTRFNDQLERFVEEPLHATVVIHRPAEYQGAVLVLIWVPSATTLPLTFKIDGQYGVTDGKGRPRSEVIFRQGEVWVRRGARCVLANAGDWRRIRSEIRRLERSQWTEDLLGVTPLVQRLDRLTSVLERWLEGGGGPGASAGTTGQTLGPSDYLLPADQLFGRIDAVYQAGEAGRARRFILGAPVAFYHALDALETGSAEDLERGKDNHLRPILDSIATTAALAAEYEYDDEVKAAHEAFWRIYERANRTTFPAVHNVHLDATWVWGEVIKRVYLVGAVLVERRRYAAVADLIEQPVEWDSYWESLLWARHALTMMSRSNRLERRGLVAEVANDFRRDPSVLLPFGGDIDRATDALCQFDFLQCVHVVSLRDDIRAAYPSFAWYYKQRTEPIIRALITRPEARSQAIPQMDDERLAAIITGLDQVAGHEAFMAAGWSSNSWSDSVIQQFLTEHAPRDPKELL